MRRHQKMNQKNAATRTSGEEHEKRAVLPARPDAINGRLNHESQRRRGLRHALVIGNQDFQLGGNPLRRRKVYRVQRSEHSGVERRRAIQQRIVQTYEMNPVKDQSRSAQGCGSEVTNGAGHLGSRQRARDSIAMAPDEAAKRPRFRLAHDQFYDCGRVEIDHRSVLPAQRSCLRMRARRRDAVSCPLGTGSGSPRSSRALAGAPHAADALK